MMKTIKIVRSESPRDLVAMLRADFEWLVERAKEANAPQYDQSRPGEPPYEAGNTFRVAEKEGQVLAMPVGWLLT
jgi:hypothetical protein